MFDLQKKLRGQQPQELIKGKVARAESKVQDARKQNELIKQHNGNLSVSEEQMSSALKDLDSAKAEEVPEFDPDWFPTLWRAYMAFGPTLEDRHGHVADFYLWEMVRA